MLEDKRRLEDMCNMTHVVAIWRLDANACRSWRLMTAGAAVCSHMALIACQSHRMADHPTLITRLIVMRFDAQRAKPGLFYCGAT